MKRHKPSVIYIPNVDSWWASLGDAALVTFETMLKSIPPTDPVLLLATAEKVPRDLDPGLLRNLFGYSKKNRAVIARPNRVSCMGSCADPFKPTDLCISRKLA